MGMCGIGIFEQLFLKYGEDLVKFVVGQKTKEHLVIKTEQGKKEITKKIAQTKSNVLKEIDTQQGKVTQMVDQNKKKLSGGIPANFGGSADKMFGTDAIKEKFATLRKEADQKFANSEKEVHGQMDSTKVRACTQITNQEPKIPGWDLLTDCAKRSVMKQGQQKFADQIEKSKKESMNSFKDLSADSFTAKLQNIMPTDSITGITKDAQSKIDMAVKAANGGGLMKNLF